MDFSCVLQREKFVIWDASGPESSPPLVALSNRINLSFKDAKGKTVETLIVRSKSMHLCIRMAAKLVLTYQHLGPLMARETKYDFDGAWNDIIADFERGCNHDCWVSLYNNGKRIYKANDYHAFLDVIENCYAQHESDSYESSITVAENIFAKSGKKITIDYDGATGMILDVRNNRARSSMILRSPLRRQNFNFIADLRPENVPEINIPQCLNAAAAFLEGVQHAFFIGRINAYQRANMPLTNPDDARIARAARQRLQNLNAQIQALENRYLVKYRPEKPEFPAIVVEAERFFANVIESEKEREAAPAT